MMPHYDWTETYETLEAMLEDLKPCLDTAGIPADFIEPLLRDYSACWVETRRTVDPNQDEPGTLLLERRGFHAWCVTKWGERRVREAIGAVLLKPVMTGRVGKEETL